MFIMKMHYLILLVTPFFFLTCSPESDSIPKDETITYKYEIEALVFKNAFVNQSSYGKIEGLEAYQFAIDTLFINLNFVGQNHDGYYDILGIKTYIYAQNMDDYFVENTLPHVNYIKFIDFNLSNHYYETVFLQTNWPAQKYGFTYTESNINLANYPKLFAINPINPFYRTMEIKPKRGHQIIEHITSDNLNIGEKITKNGWNCKVISKTQI